jgi:hypothetical protein
VVPVSEGVRRKSVVKAPGCCTAAPGSAPRHPFLGPQQEGLVYPEEGVHTQQGNITKNVSVFRIRIHLIGFGSSILGLIPIRALIHGFDDQKLEKIYS